MASCCGVDLSGGYAIRRERGEGLNADDSLNDGTDDHCIRRRMPGHCDGQQDMHTRDHARVSILLQLIQCYLCKTLLCQSIVLPIATTYVKLVTHACSKWRPD